MKCRFFIVVLLSMFIVSGCMNATSDTGQVNIDSLRADSIWKVRIADSINKERGIAKDPSTRGSDTGVIGGVENITRGMKEGLDKVQEGLDKMKKVRDVSATTAKEIADGIKKTADAIHKTVNDTKKTINGE